MSEKKKFRSGLLCGLLISILLLGTVYTGTQVYKLYRYATIQEASAPSGDGVVNTETNTKMQIVKDLIEEYYLESVEDKMLEAGVYKGMIASLEDPYAAYYTTEELEEIRQSTEGIYYGIGAYVGKDVETGLCKISGVIENTPAEESGLRYGDLLYQVNGESMEGKDTSEVVSCIKGEEGSIVTLTIVREGETDFLNIDVERRKIESPTVEYEMLESDIGYIQIKEFDDITLPQFIEAMAVCKGSEMKGLILDLRDNPGGNLGTVTDIARELLPKGLIVYTEDKNGERIEYSCDGAKETQVPMVVLINGGSASASEILAGAIQDYGKGALLGTTTFGKGIVQRIIPLTDGSALKLTVSHYYTPKGNNIHEVGIEPDEELKFDVDAYLKDETDNQLDRAIEILKSQQ